MKAAEKVLYLPPPPVVPVEDVKPLLEALEIPANIQREGDIWSIHPHNFKLWKEKISKALSTFTAKHKL